VVDAPIESVPLILKLYVPVTIGVPLITPVRASKFKPLGKKPIRDSVTAPVPPIV
jgi:hypothetical protein